MTKRNFTILGIIILTIAVIASGVFWYKNKEELPVSNEQEAKEQDEEQDKQEIVKKDESNNQSNDEGIEVFNTDNIDTSDWKIYRSEEYGFEIRHSEGWYVTVKRGVESSDVDMGFAKWSDIYFSNCKNVSGGKLMPKECIFYNISVNKVNAESIARYNGALSKMKDRSKNQYQENVVLPNGILSVYGLYQAVDNFDDGTKPLLSGYFKDRETLYIFGHATEIYTQKESVKILRSAMNTFKLLK